MKGNLVPIDLIWNLEELERYRCDAVDEVAIRTAYQDSMKVNLISEQLIKTDPLEARLFDYIDELKDRQRWDVEDALDEIIGELKAIMIE